MKPKLKIILFIISGILVLLQAHKNSAQGAPIKAFLSNQNFFYKIGHFIVSDLYFIFAIMLFLTAVRIKKQ